MSLFSTKYKTTVYAQAQRVIEDPDKLPNTMKDATLESIMTGEDLIDVTLRNYSRSLSIKAEKAYEYGGQGYIFGRPKGFEKRTSQADEAIFDVLTSMHPGSTINMVYTYVCQPNSMHIAWMRLINEFGYNRDTNEIVGKSTPSWKVYLEDIDIYQPDELKANYPTASMMEWEWSTRAGYTAARQIQKDTKAFNFIPNTGPIFSVGVTREFARVIYSYTDVIGSGNVQEYSYDPARIIAHFDIQTVEGLDLTADYYHVMYTVDGVSKFFFYKIGEGSIPSLDVVYETELVNGSFFPRAYFRFNKTNLNTDKQDPTYKQMKKLLKKAGLDYDQLADGIVDNPDSKDVEIAALTFDVRALWKRPTEEDPIAQMNQSQVELKYLYDFFLDLYGANGPDGWTSVAADDLDQGYQPGETEWRYHLEIRDQWLNTRLAFNGIYKRRVRGSIGPIGTYASEGRTTPIDQELWSDSESGTPRLTTVTYNRGSHVYKKQISHAMYDEIEIYSLCKMYQVYGNAWYFAQGLDDALTIPLDYAIMSAYPIKEREKLYAASVMMTVTSRVITEVKWYQQSWFLELVKMAGFAMTFIFMGSDGGFFASLGTALAQAGVYGVVRIIINLVLNRLVMMLITEVLVRVLGVSGAIVLAVLAIAVGGLAGEGIPGVASAQQLTTLGNGLMKAAKDEVADLLKDIKQEFSDLSGMQKALEKDVNAAKDLLNGPDNKLSPFVIFGESPTNYFGRTVHSGNIGVLALDSVSTFVASALKLPDINDSLGENSDA